MNEEFFDTERKRLMERIIKYQRVKSFRKKYLTLAFTSIVIIFGVFIFSNKESVNFDNNLIKNSDIELEVLENGFITPEQESIEEKIDELEEEILLLGEELKGV